MLKVGLTGNIASGKSSVANVWRDLGARVIDADVLARRAVAPGTEGLAAIVERWGPRVLNPQGELDRAALREIVFGDAAERARLEEIVHPVVRRLRDAAIAEARSAGATLAVADIPLLFEVGMQDEFDLVVLVDAPEAVRLQRLVRDRGLDPSTAGEMVAAQMPAAQKRERADIVIDNDGSLAELESRASEVWADLSRRAEAR